MITDKQRKTANKVRSTNRVMNIFKADLTLSTYAKNAIKECVFNHPKIYVKRWHISGKHRSLKDHTYYIESILKATRYKYVKGNDAIRGGEEGNYIKVSKSAINFLKSLK